MTPHAGDYSCGDAGRRRRSGRRVASMSSLRGSSFAGARRADAFAPQSSVATGCAGTHTEFVSWTSCVRSLTTLLPVDAATVEIPPTAIAADAGNVLAMVCRASGWSHSPVGVASDERGRTRYPCAPMAPSNVDTGAGAVVAEGRG